MHQLPETGFLRLSQIIGNPKAEPPIPSVIPVSKSSWWDGVKSGNYPQPVYLGSRTTAWRVEDIRALIAKLSSPCAPFATGTMAVTDGTEETSRIPSGNTLPQPLRLPRTDSPPDSAEKNSLVVSTIKLSHNRGHGDD